MLKVFLSNLSFSLFQFFLVFFILKNEGTDKLGYYALYISILNPLQQLFKLGIPKLILSEINFQEQKSYYILSFYSFITFLIVGMICIFFIDMMFLDLFISLICFKALINVRESVFSIYLRHKIYDVYFQSSSTANILLIVLFWITYRYTEELSVCFFICNLVILLFVVIDTFRQKRILKLHYSDLYNFRNLQKLISRMLKLSLANTLFSLKSNIPRYVLASNFSVNFLGIYTAIYQAVSVIEIANQSIVKYFGASLTTSFNKSISLYKKLEKRIYTINFAVTFFSFFVAFLFGNTLINFFLGEEFLPHSSILLIMIFERYFFMINSVPKTTFILSDKIHLLIINTFLVAAIMYPVLSFIDSFILFIYFTAFFAVVMFLVNKVTINKLYKHG